MGVLTGYQVRTWLPSSSTAQNVLSNQQTLGTLEREFDKYAVLCTRKALSAELRERVSNTLKRLETELIPAHERVAFHAVEQLAWAVFGVRIGAAVLLTTGPLKQWPIRVLALTVHKDGTLEVVAEALDVHRLITLRFAAQEQFIAEPV